jgi:hypothetical protein
MAVFATVSQEILHSILRVLDYAECGKILVRIYGEGGAIPKFLADKRG